MYRAEEINRLVSKYKPKIKKQILRKEYDAALSLISLSADLLYASNVYYMDEELENDLIEISESLIPHDQVSTNDERDVVIFYDGFGLNVRGLSLIYLRVLCPRKKIFYITYEHAKGNIPDIVEVVDSHGGKCFYLGEGRKADQIAELFSLVKAIRPSQFFFCSVHNDVVGTTLLYAMHGCFHRYQINLTDHGFWLGAKAFDTCIEFRDLGANISRQYRGIQKEKLCMIPFYPQINYKAEFQGFPFPVEAGQKIVFSGGSFYKTIGKENLYYQMVDYLLSNHPDVIFWYAGDGHASDRKILDKILTRYPGRAFLTKEREDLYQILQRCCFYLSTYPWAGGLMFQYAAKANKIPLTLYYDEHTKGCLIDEDKLGIGFDSIGEVEAEMDRLLTDEPYRRKKESVLSDHVISEDAFAEEVSRLIGQEEMTFSIKWHDVETSHFRKLYLESLTSKAVNAIISRHGWNALSADPIRFFKGIVDRVGFKVIRLGYRIRNGQ